MRQIFFLLALTLTVPPPPSNYPLISAGKDETSRSTSLRPVEFADVDASPDPEALFQPEALLIKDQDFLTAYRNGFTILSTDNTCSLFFGDRTGRLTVFSQMLARFRKGYFNVGLGILMSGNYSNYQDVSTGLQYRLFEKETVNTQGAFYNQKRFGSQPNVPGVGQFAPNTRGARVLMLLHELAHLIRGKDGHWLIPDDGSDINQSRRNTELVEKYCGEYIRKIELGLSQIRRKRWTDF